MLPDDLPQDESLRRLYRGLPLDEPPAYVDAAIRAAARRQLVARRPWWRSLRWQVPLAAAATAGLTLVLLRGPLEDELRSTVLREQAAAPAGRATPKAAAPAEENFAPEQPREADAAAAPPPAAAITPAQRAAGIAPAPGEEPARRSKAAPDAPAAAGASGAVPSQHALGFGSSRSSGYPFELTPDTEPENACASLAPALRPHCRAARTAQGQLEVVLATGDRSLHQKLFEAIADAAWQESKEGTADERRVFVDPSGRHLLRVEVDAEKLRLTISQR